MKQLIFSLIISCCLAATQAQTWQPLGPNDINQPAYGYTTSASIAVSNRGIPYILIQDTMVGRKATVRKFVGNTWVNVGIPGLSTGMVTYIHIAIDNEGVPYVIFADGGNNNRIAVKKFDGSNWINAGNPNISTGAASYSRIAIDSSGDIYIVFVDEGDGNKAHVKKLNEGNWQDVGAAGVSTDNVAYTTIAITRHGTPYIGYQDNVNNKIVVKKYDGNVWTDITPADLATSAGTYPLLACGDGDTLTMAYLTNGAIRVLKYNEAGWDLIGSTFGTAPFSFAVDNKGVAFIASAGFGGVSVYMIAPSVNHNIGELELILTKPDYAVIALDSSGTLFLSYNDNSFKAIVKKYNGNYNWTLLGETGFTRGPDASMAVSSRGTPYVVYKDYSLDMRVTNRLRIKKFNDSAWVGVDDGVAYRSILPVSIAIDTSGVPYIAYVQYPNFAYGIVRRFNGVFWEQVGANPFTFATDLVRLAVNKQGIPYVAFTDFILSGKATVKKLNGNDWVNVGPPGFSDGRTRNISFKIDSNGILYIAYRDEGNGNKLTVKKFDGSIWQNAGNAGLPEGPVSSLALSLTNGGTPYVLFADATNANKATVKKLAGNNWITVGEPGFSPGAIAEPSLTIDTNEVVYVNYVDSTNRNRANVMEFDGSSWRNLSDGGLSTGWVSNTSIAIGNSGLPMVMYSYYDAYVKQLISEPLQLFQFAGKNIGSHVLLTWRTKNAGSSAPFVVERSLDSVNFSAIGTVQVKNHWSWLFDKLSPGIANYFYIDRQAASFQKPVIYYRLRQENNAGHTTFSKVLAIPFVKQNAFVLFHPNPFTNNAAVTITVDFPQQVQIRIINSAGLVVQTQHWSLSSGSTTLSLSTAGLIRGTYFLDVRGASINKQFNIVKQ